MFFIDIFLVQTGAIRENRALLTKLINKKQFKFKI